MSCRFQNQPVGGVGANEQIRAPARLADAGLADDRYDLTTTLAGKLQRQTELLLLDIAADKACQASSRCGVQAGSRRARHRSPRKSVPDRLDLSPVRGPSDFMAT